LGKQTRDFGMMKRLSKMQSDPGVFGFLPIFEVLVGRYRDDLG